jgi:very-short-patch-repair endonuclease
VELFKQEAIKRAALSKATPYRRYIADFYCPDLKLIIEVDGPMHNLKIEYDRTRTEEMAKVGLQVIRFTNDEIIADIGLVIEKIKCSIN